MGADDIFLSGFIGMMIEKLSSYENLMSRSERRISSKLRKLQNILPLIQAVLADAAQKQIREEAVKVWLGELHQLAYDIDDLIDELATKTARNTTTTAADNVLNKILPKSIKYGGMMSSRLDEITLELQDLFSVKDRLGLNNIPSSYETRRPRMGETSIVAEAAVVGREGDKEAFMRRLLGDDDMPAAAASQNFSVVSITGMGGIGKTTLARVLYNDNKIKDHFELRAWATVAEDFDVFGITKAIYESSVGEFREFATLDLLQEALMEQLSNKRLLLVLDDVWNEDHRKWELLQRPFHVGAPGSRIIVTTRMPMVAEIMGSVHTYKLGFLSDEDAMSMFAINALGEQNFDSRPDLKPIAEGIIQKCGRWPLALKTVGAFLRIRTSREEWEEFLNTDIVNFGSDDILPALTLSYNELPGILKHLFAYCSFFPKDYRYQKDELVRLWMAEGFLYQSNDIISMEGFGHKCFEELLSRSFFQHSTNDNEYIMHDLLHDLAKVAGGELFFTLLDDDMGASSYESEALDKVRHLSFVCQRFRNDKNFKALLRARRLRTLLAVSDSLDGRQKFFLSNKVLTEIIPQLQFLRVLNLCNYSITEIPQSIGSLKHLRYLNFSRTDIACLPEQVGELYNLQSLLLRGCENLFSLPKSLVNLSNLRHLDIRGTPSLNKKLLRIGELKDLQILSHGDDVELRWNDEFDDPDKRIAEYEELEGLIPHHEVRNLKILFYGGMKFPRWVGDSSFVCLTELTLRGCRRCSQLPTLGYLKSLQKLFVEGMNKVKNVGPELLGPTDSLNDSAFPSLQVLEFKDMQGWKKWSIRSDDHSGDTKCFRILGEISIVNCPKLADVSVGFIRSLRVLRIQRCREAVLESMVCVSSSIVKLMIEDIKGLTGLHVEVLGHLRAVEYLSIKQCDKLEYLWETESEACENLVCLSKLEVQYCKSLLSLEKEKSNLISSMTSIKHVVVRNCESLDSCKCPTSIERLEISDCRSIKSLTFPTLQVGLQSSLKILDIQRCDNLWGSWLLSDFLTSLDYLQMGRLPNLRSMPEGCFGDLTRLILRGCDHVESITEKGLDFGRLRALEIISCMGLKSFPHEHLPNLKSLEQLWISNCPSLDAFPCGKWPPNLKSLTIGGLKKPMSKWGQQNFPASLVTLYLHGENSGLVSFASNSTSSSFDLPTSLTFLEINGFLQLKSVSEGLQHLTNLKGLVIDSCPKLGDLPVARLSELSSLKVYNCLKLQERCYRKYRRDISGITELYV